MLRQLTRGVVGSAVLGAAALGFMAPSTALADRSDRHDYRAQRASDRGDRYREQFKGDRRDDYDRTDVRLDLRIGGDPFCREPLFQERETRVWVEPVYRTVCERVWVEPVYRDECERVWVPDRWEVRDRVYRDECGRRVVARERVLVEPGHWEERVHRVLVCEGYWKTVERQELVRQGHWEVRRERFAVGDSWRDDSFINIRARFNR
jgi:hypothetical protein